MNENTKYFAIKRIKRNEKSKGKSEENRNEEEEEDGEQEHIRQPHESVECHYKYVFSERFSFHLRNKCFIFLVNDFKVCHNFCF